MPISDRVVQEIFATHPVLEDGRNRFSTYLGVPNVVLLGDPGAGKSHLFKEFAALEQGQVLVARTFLNTPSTTLSTIHTIYVDALDERRNGRGDHGAIDEIVRQLIAAKPKKVRIACRAVDWLGETDLSVLRTYFDQTGNTAVLALQQLNQIERINVLATKNVNSPQKFLEEAEDRGLGELLGNPQNLSMLIDVVQRSGRWPETRKELFQEAANVLLAEHNEVKTRNSIGSYSAAELTSVAGKLAAVRLIGDISSIALTAIDLDTDVPSYRNLCASEKEIALAALNRRAFISVAGLESVDYAHRTVAEYLAAAWLATQIRSGLPLGRVQALVGVNGRPATELRGLHAWLAVLLHEHSQQLISADPYGVLSYSDVKALSPLSRQHLLHALATLAETDPWFRRHGESIVGVSALTGADMQHAFREILQSTDTAFTLRTLVLEALCTGAALTDLAADLLVIASNKTAPYLERRLAIQAMKHMNAIDLVRKLYPQLGEEESELRLRSYIVETFYGNDFGIEELVDIFRTAAHTKAKLPGGALFGLVDAVPTTQLVEVLNRISVFTQDGGNDFDETGARWELLHQFDTILARTLVAFPDQSGDVLLNWFEFRRKSIRSGYGNSDQLKSILQRDTAMLFRLIDAALKAFSPEKGPWLALHTLFELSFGAAEEKQILPRVVDAALRETNAVRKEFLYGFSLILALRLGPEHLALFENLFDYAEEIPTLQSERDRCCFVEIPEWRTEHAERRLENKRKRDVSKEHNREQFERHRNEIRDGKHRGWIEWIAQVYLGLFNDIDREASPYERLTTELGENNAATAMRGLLTFAQTQQTPGIEDVLRLNADGKYQQWWFAVLASLDEFEKEGGALTNLRDEYLMSALAIQELHPVPSYKNNITSTKQHAWRTELLRTRPELVTAVYQRLAQDGLSRRSSHVAGLRPLLHEEALKALRAEAALSLLTEFPECLEFSLRELLHVAIWECNATKLAAVIEHLKNTVSSSHEAYPTWLAAAYLIDPSNHSIEVRELVEPLASRMVWAFRDLSGARHQRQDSFRELSVHQTEEIALLVMRVFPSVDHPQNGWSGDQNAWDATDYAHRLLGQLSANASKGASEALARMAENPASSGYLAAIKHRAAQQFVLRCDVEYTRPTWQDAISTLSNLRPSGIADLQALLVAHLEDLKPQIASSNTDVYKRFWNENGRGQILLPKSEESCRDVLVDLLRDRLSKKGVLVEPEGHMAEDKRADIVALMPSMKVVLELKRDHHRDLWTAIEGQLDRFYTRDPDAQGYGIYGIFWYGEKRGTPITAPPNNLKMPATASELQQQLVEMISPSRKNRISVVVLDVSGSSVSTVGTARQNVLDKFRDDKGNTWSGRGRRPKWLKDAIATGKSLSDLKA